MKPCFTKRHKQNVLVTTEVLGLFSSLLPWASATYSVTFPAVFRPLWPLKGLVTHVLPLLLLLFPSTHLLGLSPPTLATKDNDSQISVLLKQFFLLKSSSDDVLTSSTWLSVGCSVPLCPKQITNVCVFGLLLPCLSSLVFFLVFFILLKIFFNVFCPDYSFLSLYSSSSSPPPFASEPTLFLSLIRKPIASKEL